MARRLPIAGSPPAGGVRPSFRMVEESLSAQEIRRGLGRGPRCLAAWIGRQDLDGISANEPSGPIVDFLRVHPEAEAFLLSDWRERERPRDLNSGTGA